MKKFIRAIAKGVMYFRDNKEGSYASLKNISASRATRRRRLYGTSCTTPSRPSCLPISTGNLRIPPARLIAAKEWPKDKPLPDPEQYLARDMLDATLKDMNYVPTKIDAKAN